MSNILVTQEEDGSQWVSLEDYRVLQSKFRDFLNNVYDIVSVQCDDVGEAHAGLQDEVIAIRKSGLTSRAVDGLPAYEHGTSHWLTPALYRLRRRFIAAGNAEPLAIQKTTS